MSLIEAGVAVRIFSVIVDRMIMRLYVLPATVLSRSIASGI